ncbi:MAG: hypothetical protein N2506_07195, partial [Dehalococcoidales bacterium]|nr:hypothetical protein [Dehalococcoidales bacterium]
QRHLADMARAAGTRVMGPNSVGTLNPYFPFDSSLGRLNRLFYPQGTIRKGTVGFIGQTGLFTGVYLPLLNEEIGISKIACLGNKCDVDETDMLAYFADDPSTKVIAMYLEDIRRGRDFVALAKTVTRKKPVLAIKSAVTGAGARASATHTGSLAGDDRVYDAAFRQAGVIRIGSFDQLWDVLRGFVHAPLPRGNRVAIINLAGSGCVTAVDACMRYGLEIAGLSEDTRARIGKVYPDWWQVRNPVDVWVAIEASGFAATYTTTTRAVLADENVDGAIVIMGAIDWLEGADVPALFRTIRQEFPQKPLLTVAFLGERGIYLRMHRGFQEAGIPCYQNDEAAIMTFAAMWRYSRYLSGPGN